MNIWRRIKNLFVAVTPEPDSTEDSTGGLEPPEVPHVPHRIPGKSPTRRMSQPVTGSPKDQDKSTNRRASEGEYQFFQSLADLDNERAFILGSAKLPTRATTSSEDGEDRGKMATGCKGMGADWGTEASSFSHIWIPTSTSGDASYLRILGFDCPASGNRVKCVACRIVVHEACVETLNAKYACRPSFCESVRKYREFTTIPHHWVQRKQLKV